MNKISLVICAVIATALIMAVPSYCGEDDQTIRTIDGNIVSADWEDSSITVKWLNTPGVIEYNEETFYVPQNARIMKGGDNIWLMDLEVGAHVMVDYYEDGDTLTVKNVIVKD
ncbi:MAG: hypothetical protein KKD29_02465 [Candidatus Omnitrophica bacterium]|nr:hypothetical protein [Candidatus Omnitrophota bacterium]MBU4487897.1 hypothetical protein [Candidatus Omnitrophota bacterium]MCG2705514.1 hypothetical protein [Candidatus Omnitrophota bacterium]